MEIKTLCGQDETYSNYRIPGLCVSKKGTLLAYFEARRTSSDWANMDILLFRSENGGRSFSKPICMAQGTEQYQTVNNPVCIAGADGRLHFLYCRNYSVSGGDVFYRYSDDDGLTWSTPENIMYATRPELHNAFALGPGHGIALSNGTLLVPIWMVLKSSGAPLMSHNPAVVSTLYSRDNGKTWALGEIIPPNEANPDPNETQAVELADGRVYLNVRSTLTGYRAYTRSAGGELTGVGGFSPLALDTALPDPTCFGSVVAYRHDGVNAVLCVNCASQSERENLTVNASFDEAVTWSKSLTVTTGDAGYADIAVGHDGKIHVLYEVRAGEYDNLATFSIEELKNKESSPWNGLN